MKNVMPVILAVMLLSGTAAADTGTVVGNPSSSYGRIRTESSQVPAAISAETTPSPTAVPVAESGSLAGVPFSAQFVSDPVVTKTGREPSSTEVPVSDAKDPGKMVVMFYDEQPETDVNVSEKEDNAKADANSEERSGTGLSISVKEDIAKSAPTAPVLQPQNPPVSVSEGAVQEAAATSEKQPEADVTTSVKEETKQAAVIVPEETSQSIAVSVPKENVQAHVSLAEEEPETRVSISVKEDDTKAAIAVPVEQSQGIAVSAPAGAAQALVSFINEQPEAGVSISVNDDASKESAAVPVERPQVILVSEPEGTAQAVVSFSEKQPETEVSISVQAGSEKADTAVPQGQPQAIVVLEPEGNAKATVTITEKQPENASAAASEKTKQASVSFVESVPNEKLSNQNDLSDNNQSGTVSAADFISRFNGACRVYGTDHRIGGNNAMFGYIPLNGGKREIAEWWFGTSCVQIQTAFGTPNVLQTCCAAGDVDLESYGDFYDLMGECLTAAGICEYPEDAFLTLDKLSENMENGAAQMRINGKDVYFTFDLLCITEPGAERMIGSLKDADSSAK